MGQKGPAPRRGWVSSSNLERFEPLRDSNRRVILIITTFGYLLATYWASYIGKIGY